jgi:hypothetical protein
MSRSGGNNDRQSLIGAREQRLQIMLSPEELTVIDKFRFEARMPSRAAAVRELLKRGLAAEGFLEAAFGAPSESLGVIDDDDDARSSPE